MLDKVMNAVPTSHLNNVSNVVSVVALFVGDRTNVTQQMTPFGMMIKA